MRVVLTNLPANKGAEIARILVEERLAACVNLLPIRSFYRWNGAIIDDSEETLLIKVSDSRVTDLRERLLRLHPYELPEIVVFGIDEGQSLTAYLQWVDTETNPTDSGS